MKVVVVLYQMRGMTPDWFALGCICANRTVAEAWVADDRARSGWRDDDDYRIEDWTVLTQWP